MPMGAGTLATGGSPGSGGSPGPGGSPGSYYNQYYHSTTIEPGAQAVLGVVVTEARLHAERKAHAADNEAAAAAKKESQQRIEALEKRQEKQQEFKDRAFDRVLISFVALRLNSCIVNIYICVRLALRS